MMNYTFLAIAMLFIGLSQSAFAQEALVEGPLKEKRAHAFNYIKKAESYGVGTKPYLKAFQALEVEVQNGIEENKLKRRLDSITRSVYQQMLRARDIKQRALSGGGMGGISAAELKKYKGKRVPVSILENLMFSYINNERKKKKIDTLGRSSRLAGLARKHSEDMMKRNYFRHKNPEGLTAFGRAQEAGLNISIFENIAKVATGRGTPVSKAKIAHKALMHSTGHRQNILNPKSKTCGVGISYGKSGKIAVTELFSYDCP